MIEVSKIIERISFYCFTNVDSVGQGSILTTPGRFVSAFFYLNVIEIIITNLAIMIIKQNTADHDDNPVDHHVYDSDQHLPST